MDVGERKCTELVHSLSDRELEALIDINERIMDLTHYGRRTEYVDRPSTYLLWSNADKKWCVMHTNKLGAGPRREVRVGNEIELSPNQLVVPYPRRLVEKLSPCLKVHPLYFCSFEAKARGEVDPLQASLCWAAKQLERIKREEFQEENR